MMRINLLPPEERASMRVIQISTVLFICGVFLIAALSFATVYLRWQVVNERERLESYQTTLGSVSRYRREMSHMERETRELEQLVQPLKELLAANQDRVDLSLLLRRTSTAAQVSNLWLRELTVQKDGHATLTGYCVELAETSRFLANVGLEPFRVQMSSTRWIEESDLRVLELVTRMTTTNVGGKP